MTECYQNALPFPRIEGRKVEVEFSGGDIMSMAMAAQRSPGRSTDALD